LLALLFVITSALAGAHRAREEALAYEWSDSGNTDSDQRLDDALRFIQGHELLPVIGRAGSRKLEGVISLPDILAAYQRAS
jgi:hypothetical protein